MDVITNILISKWCFSCNDTLHDHIPKIQLTPIKTQSINLHLLKHTLSYSRHKQLSNDTLHDHIHKFSKIQLTPIKTQSINFFLSKHTPPYSTHQQLSNNTPLVHIKQKIKNYSFYSFRSLHEHYPSLSPHLMLGLKLDLGLTIWNHRSPAAALP